MSPPESTSLGEPTESTRQRIVTLRSQLLDELAVAPTPAVASALEMADIHILMALGYLGHTEDLLPMVSPIREEWSRVVDGVS